MRSRHVLKTDSEAFKDVWEETKNYEIRFDDRKFKVKDQLFLVETVHTGAEMKAGKPLEYTGHYIIVDVIHKLKNQYGLVDGWCVLGTSFVMGGEDFNPKDIPFFRFSTNQ